MVLRRGSRNALGWTWSWRTGYRARRIGWLMGGAVCFLASAAGGFTSSDGIRMESEIPVKPMNVTFEVDPGSLAADSELGVFGAEDSG